jgi:VWFA-related protein
MKQFTGPIRHSRRHKAAYSIAASLLSLVATFIAGPALASTDLRVEAKPISDPIEAFITVTDAAGAPVGGLTAADFIVTLDGVPIAIQPSDLTLPPAQDPNQKVSVVFAMDFSPSVTGIALTAMQNAVIDFINAMNVGDYAAIVKFNNTNPARASVVWPFTQIDQGAGNLALASAVMDAYPGNGTNLLDAINVSMDQFITPPSPLPAGPKAIIVITDGGENASMVTASEAVATANDNSIPIFIIGVGDITIQKRINLLTQLTTETGGDYLPAPGDAEIAGAYATISQLLSNEYLLTLPANAVTDCGQHVLQVTVTGQPAPASVAFGRCDTTPDPFDFPNKRNATPNATVTSSAVTISGINGPAPISVTDGQYSIGCGSANFRATNSLINNGDTVCVRHTASAAFSTETITTLTVGGVSGDFKSTTKDAPPPGGGGGATGALDLLLGLAILIARRRQRA